MRFTKSLMTLFLVGAFAFNGRAGEKYEIDASHSNVGFTVRHMVVAKVSGSFKKFSGTIVYDEQDITKSSVAVTIKATSIDTDNERRDNHLRSGDFFNAATDSLITFVSKKNREARRRLRRDRRFDLAWRHQRNRIAFHGAR